MKRIVFAILIALTAVVCGARSLDSRILALANSYRGTEGIEIVNIGQPFISLARLVMKVNAESEEDMAALNALRGFKRLLVVDYEDCAPAIKDEFSREVRMILDESELLLEAVDGGEIVRIYGVLSEEGDTVSDIVIHSESDGALICVSGTIRTEDLGDLAAATDIL